MNELVRRLGACCPLVSDTPAPPVTTVQYDTVKMRMNYS